MKKSGKASKAKEQSSLQEIFENILSLPPKAWGFRDEKEKLTWLAQQYEAWSAAQDGGASSKAPKAAKAKKPAKPAKKKKKKNKDA
jgi:hypothetical protein